MQVRLKGFILYTILIFILGWFFGDWKGENSFRSRVIKQQSFNLATETTYFTNSISISGITVGGRRVILYSDEFTAYHVVLKLEDLFNTKEGEIYGEVRKYTEDGTTRNEYLGLLHNTE